MSKVKAAILVDIGNSETRYVLVHEGKTYYNSCSNSFALLTQGYKVPEDYINNKTTVLCVNREYYATGELALREFPRKSQRPVALLAKSDQEATIRTMTLLFAQCYRKLSELTGVAIEDLDVEFDVVVALPPIEHKVKADKLKALIRSIKSVEVLAPIYMKKDVDVADIYVLSEGAAAFTAVMYDETEDGEVVESEVNEAFFDGDVLVIDIGAGTSDMVLFRDADVIIDSKDSFKKGGNAVLSACRQFINEKYDYSPTDQAMEKVLAEGVLVKGNDIIDVTDLLDRAKSGFSAELYNFLINYVQSHSIELQELKGLLVIGGGSLPAVRDGKIVSVSLAEVLVDFIMQVTNSVKLVDTKGINPRLLNIEGLRMFYLYKDE